MLRGLNGADKLTGYEKVVESAAYLMNRPFRQYQSLIQIPFHYRL
jgi:hypothetical protein